MSRDGDAVSGYWLVTLQRDRPSSRTEPLVANLAIEGHPAEWLLARRRTRPPWDDTETVLLFAVEITALQYAELKEVL